jgi:glycosyltransferase involved in cell wall biosynthesis
MKVSYVTMTFPSSPETFASTDVRVLREAGVDVAVYAIRRPERDCQSLIDNRGLRALSIDHGTVAANVSGLWACLRHPMLVAQLVDWLWRSTWRKPRQFVASLALVPRCLGILESLSRERPDVVHLFWGHYPCIVGFLILKALPNIVLSVFLGAYDLTRAFGGSGWVARRADVVWTHAACNLPDLERLGVDRSRIRVAYRGLDLHLFRSTGIVKINHRIVSVGRLIAPKGMDEVLRVFRMVQEKWPGATLVVVGDGPERAGLEHLSKSLGIHRAVKFTGHLPQRDVAREMAAAEVFLLMSHKDSERLPNVVKEAMANRCVCVVTQTPGIDELIVHEEHGFVVHRGDTATAASRIDDVFSRRVDATALLQAASDRVADRFDVTASMELYRRQWIDLVMRRRASQNRCVTTTSILPTIAYERDRQRHREFPSENAAPDAGSPR